MANLTPESDPGDSSPPSPSPTAPPRRSKLVSGPAFLLAGFGVVVLVLRLVGLIRPFSVPTAAMTPAVSAGDCVLMEGVTFLVRQPHRGDVVVFKTDGLVSLPSGELYVKRVAGEPGERVRIAETRLYINDQPVVLHNALGEIVYNLPASLASFSSKSNVTVSNGCYFVLGDNSGNSLDSRFWGGLPRTNILGRVLFCYWPPKRMGFVK